MKDYEANPTISDYPELLTQQDSFSQFKSKATPNSASHEKITSETTCKRLQTLLRDQ